LAKGKRGILAGWRLLPEGNAMPLPVVDVLIHDPYSCAFPAGG